MLHWRDHRLGAGRPLPCPEGDRGHRHGDRQSRWRRTLTLGTDNGTAYTSREFRARLGEHKITHRRGGYRDPESQAFIESWFSKLKRRCVWREEFETLDEAREKISAYIDSYHPGRAPGWPTARRARSRPPTPAA